MSELNLDKEAQALLTSSLMQGLLFLILYIGMFFLLSICIKNKKIRAIMIGAITPVFFYYSAGNLWHPLNILLYVLQIDPIGLTGGIIIGLLKPLSLISGIAVFFYLWKKKN
ncbi:MAG: hypothetical protein AAGK97_08300 [Bacteroidota bacterium]